MHQYECVPWRSQVTGKKAGFLLSNYIPPRLSLAGVSKAGTPHTANSQSHDTAGWTPEPFTPTTTTGLFHQMPHVLHNGRNYWYTWRCAEQTLHLMSGCCLHDGWGIPTQGKEVPSRPLAFLHTPLPARQLLFVWKSPVPWIYQPMTQTAWEPSEGSGPACEAWTNLTVLLTASP